jgi:CRISPR-associated endonuclease/helicase Cas3
LEEDVYSLTVEYFSGLAESKDTGKEILKAWASWCEVDSVKHLLRGKERPKVSFVVVERYAALRPDLEKAQQVEDRWERRRAFRRLAARIARLTVSVYLREGLDPARYGDPFPTGAKDDAAWFWLLNSGHYTTERGLDLGGAADENEGWGIVI